jgi:hypothetical protein
MDGDWGTKQDMMLPGPTGPVQEKQAPRSMTISKTT